MALSGSISEYITGREYRIDWEAEQSTAGNYSDITCTHYLVNDSGYSLYIGSRSNTCEIDGVADSYESASISTGGGSEIELGTTTHRVYHNADGTKAATIEGTFNIQATLSGYYVDSITASGSIELDRIARAATITSAPNFTDEDAPTVNYTNAAGAAVQELAIAIYDNAGQTAIVGYRNASKTGTSYKFNFTAAERTAMQNFVAASKSATVRFYLRTKLGGTYYYSSIAKTLTIANAAPTVSIAVTDTNAATVALTGNAAKIVLGKSNAQVVVTATPKKGATITSYSVTAGSKKATTATSTLNAVDSGTFNATVTDTRGYSVTAQKTATTVAYVPLTASLRVTMPTPAGDCTAKVTGDYFNGSFGATANTLTVQVRRSEDGGTTWGSWTNATATKTGNRYEATLAFSGLDYQKAHTFQARATDKLGTVTTEKRTVKTTPVFDWSESNFNTNVLARLLAGANVAGQLYSVGSFKTSANATATFGGSATFNGSADFSGAVTIGGAPVGGTIEDSGTSGDWRYIKFSNGLAVCYKNINTTGAINTAWGSLYESAEIASQSYPFTFAQVPSCFAALRQVSGGMNISGFESGTGTTSASPAFHLLRPTTATSRTWYCALFAVGIWRV